MTTIHETYVEATPALVPFEGTRSELQGGEYLGGYSQPDLFGPGDIITAIDGDYYFDPELRIPGNSYASDGGFPQWCAIARKEA